MQEKIERAPGRLDRREDCVDRGRFAYVAVANHEAIHLLGQRLNPLLESVALIGEGEIGALGSAGTGNAPGDRAVVGHAHDQAAFTTHQTRNVRHTPSRLGRLTPAASYGTGSFDHQAKHLTCSLSLFFNSFSGI